MVVADAGASDPLVTLDARLALGPSGQAGPVNRALAFLLSLAGVTASFLSCRVPTLSFPGPEAA